MGQGWFQRLLGAKASSAEGTLPRISARPTSADGVAVTPWLDVSTLMAISSLELRVRRLVEGLSRGIHRSARRGYSTEFTEYRPYTPGDDLRHMDWRRLARTDRPFVRQYEEESEWGCLVVMDLSASMGFGSLPHSKADYGRTLAGTLGTFLHGQGDPVGLLRFADTLEDVVPVRRLSRQLARWWPLLAAPPAGSGTGLGRALEGAHRLLKRPGLVVIVSDLLASPDSWSEPLRLLRAARHAVVVFEVLDPQELEFRYEGDTRFEHLESPLRLDLDAGQARTAYLERLAAHREACAALCSAEAVPQLLARTDLPLEPVLRSAFSEIARLRQNAGGGRKGGDPS
jgi:uncharacterized protein (DUF58 family)